MSLNNEINNSMEVMFFEARVRIRLISMVRYYVKLVNTQQYETNKKSIELLNACRKQVLDKVRENDNIAEFQELVVKYSGYDLIN